MSRLPEKSRPGLISKLSLSGLMLLPLAHAQDLSGDLKLGYRWVDVDGDTAKYDQHINLDDGPRLLDMSLRLARDGAGPDRIDLELSHLGGEPFQRLGVDIRDFGRYRFRYDRHRSEYIYDDLIILPENASVTGSTGGDFHRFDFERTRDDAGLEIDLSKRARLLLGFNRYEKSGDSTTVLALQREEFELDKPVDEVLQTYSAGLRYQFDRLTLTWTERFRAYDNASFAVLPGFSEGSSPTGPSALSAYQLNFPVSHDSWEHSLSLAGDLTPRVQINVAALLGNLDGEHRFAERGQGLTFTGSPFSVDERGGGDLQRDMLLLDLTVAYRLADRTRLLSRLRHRDLDQQADSAHAGESVRSDWAMTSDTLELGFETALTQALFLSGTWYAEQREVRIREIETGQRVSDNEQTRQNGFEAAIDWRPNDYFDLRGSAEERRIDDPYSLNVPSDARRYQISARIRPLAGLELSAAYRWQEHDNQDSRWRASDTRTLLRLAWRTESLLLSVGATRVDLDREIQAEVLAPAGRLEVFDIAYEAESSSTDALIEWQASSQLRFAGSYRRYDNEGSFDVKRDDARLQATFDLSERYQLGLGYRDVDYEEGSLEAYDARLIEATFRLCW